MPPRACRPVAANGQPVLAAYAPEPGGGRRVHAIQVLTVAGGRVARNVMFADPAVLKAFGLPERISSGESG